MGGIWPLWELWAFDDIKVIEGKVDEEEVYHYRMDTM